MELPVGLRAAIENEISGVKHEQLRQTAQIIRKKYRSESKDGRRLMTSKHAKTTTTG